MFSFSTYFAYVPVIPSQEELDAMLKADGFRQYRAFNGELLMRPPESLETWEPNCKWPVVMEDREGVRSCIFLSSLDCRPLPRYLLDWIRSKFAGSEYEWQFEGRTTETGIIPLLAG